MKKRPLVTCRCCSGKGIVELDDTLYDTLICFSGKRRLTAFEIAELFEHSCHATSVNNRLERLRKLGFLAREKRGRFWLYFLDNRK